MARRIALTMLSLVGALLLGAVVPLGLITTARERASFRQDTVLTARAFAAIAEDGLTEPGRSPAIAAFLTRASKSGEAGWVYNVAGRLIAHSTETASPGGLRLPARPAAPVPAIVRAVQRGGGVSITGPPGRLQVAVAVDTTADRAAARRDHRSSCRSVGRRPRSGPVKDRSLAARQRPGPAHRS